MTLVEATIAVTVVGILSALAVPTFGGALRRTQNGTADANLTTAVLVARTLATDGVAPTAAALGAAHPGLVFVDATTASTGPNVVSVLSDGTFTAAARSPSGTCRVVTAVPGSDTTFTSRPGSCTAFYGTNGVVTTLAGSTWGTADGTGSAAQFNGPVHLTVDRDGNVIIADTTNHRIRRMTPDGTVTTIAGSVQGYLDGPAATARFYMPHGVAVDRAGNIYVADSWNHRIRRIGTDGQVTTLAGGLNWGAFADGTGTAARFNKPTGLAIDADDVMYVADYENHRIRRVTTSGVVTTIAGSSTPGFADGVGSAARFNFPTGVAVDADGVVYVADYANHRVRRVATDGTVTTLAGSTSGFADGPGTAARFNLPHAVAVDLIGRLYVADISNHRIRRILPDGTVTTVAGSTSGFADGTGTAARFNTPAGVAVDAGGALWVSDLNNWRIRRIA